MRPNENAPRSIIINTYATVTATGSANLTGVINGVSTTIGKLAHVTAAVNDVVLVTKVGPMWWAVGKAYTAPAPVENDTPPDPKPVVTSGTLVISPVETRSYRPTWGWRTDNDDVYHGEYGSNGNHTGCAFYGAKPRSLAGATVTRATVKVKRPAGTGSTYGAVSTTMRLLTNSTRPSGAPTLSSSTTGPTLAAGDSTTFTIPNAWAQAIVDGTAGGIAFYSAGGSPYIIYAGRGKWSAAFTLSINWQRG
ncbi:hypothetical protein KBX03_07565 [Micromonospora sp. C72]|uniref:hypothetical protein n=1 Tax=Micromonospora sp. C72 TaxID=2824880 RepID=UPI001B35C7D7|nr:hypothetical protein [Micromonospora sp. C72]MBQ1042361.1 hypothetical protein [Micromonospora sp. C72]